MKNIFLLSNGKTMLTCFCFGSGRISEDIVKIHNSPFAVESAHIKFKNSDLSAYVYRSLFDVARQYRESFEVYGSKNLLSGH